MSHCPPPGELLARLETFPKLRAALASLPPKMLRLRSGQPPAPFEPGAGDLAARASTVQTQLRLAAFGSEADAAVVPRLYGEYLARLSVELHEKLSLPAGEMHAQGPPPPALAPPADEPLHLADGQLLLLLPEADARRAGGEGEMHLATVKAGAVRRVSSGGGAELDVDGYSQVVLPWRPHSEQKLRHGFQVLRGLGERWVKLNEAVQGVTAATSASRIGPLSRDLEGFMRKAQVVPEFTEAVVKVHPLYPCDPPTAFPHSACSAARRQVGGAMQRLLVRIEEAEAEWEKAKKQLAEHESRARERIPGHGEKKAVLAIPLVDTVVHPV